MLVGTGVFSNANIRSVEIFLSFEHYLTVDFVCAFDLWFFFIHYHGLYFTSSHWAEKALYWWV